ncbi:MAG: 5'/3'-nucleotidase SurE, partial [Pirellulaceae bacterium]|nr:5'/3'-nucleotidase SurE [Pirellulaceae bacterium]
LNAGINVLYSGTVAAAIEGAFFGITSIAVSLEYSEQANFQKSAIWARQIIRQIMEQKERASLLYNLNMPTSALEKEELPEVHITPMSTARYGEDFIRRKDPKGRTYYWATCDPPIQAEPVESDVAALSKGHLSLTPLQFDMTKHYEISTIQNWGLHLAADESVG